MKSKITHVIIIIVAIVVISAIAIFIKEMLSKTELQKLKTTE